MGKKVHTTFDCRIASNAKIKIYRIFSTFPQTPSTQQRYRALLEIFFQKKILSGGIQCNFQVPQIALYSDFRALCDMNLKVVHSIYSTTFSLIGKKIILASLLDRPMVQWFYHIHITRISFQSPLVQTKKDLVIFSLIL